MKKIFWGLFFILAGAFVIINQLGYYTELSLFTLLFTVVLIPILIMSIAKINFPGILFSIAFLCITYSTQLGIESITPWPILLTALLCSIGLSIMFDKKNFYKVINCSGTPDEIINGTDSEVVNLSINFGSAIKYVNSEDFKTANLSCSFSEMKVYFDNAKIIGDTAIINVDVSLAGLELYIPKEWKVDNRIAASLGSVDEKNKPKSNPEKTVIIQGRVNLAEVVIIYI